MVRSTCKKKHFKKRSNQTIKLWGGDQARSRFKCPYCDATLAYLNGVYAHCNTFHPDKPAPNAELIRSCSIAIPMKAAASLPVFEDIISKHMEYAASVASAASAASAAPAAPAVPVAVRSDPRAQRLERMRPHPFVDPALNHDSGHHDSRPAACGANVARVSDPKAVASMAAAAADKYPLPPDIFYDNIFGSELMFDPVIACDGYTYERIAILKWFSEHDTSPTTNAPMLNKDLIPNRSLRSAINQWADAAANARAAQATSSRARPSTKVRPASY
jgi:hypothetical protein